MRLLIVPALAIAGAVGAVEDPNLRANVGVGLGTLLFESIGYTDTVLGQTCAATTNGSFSNQLFFVTTGTGGAKDTSGGFVDNRPLRDYVRDNLDALAKEIAAGQGESLATLAELAGVAEADRAAFYQKLQANFARIFPDAEVSSDQVVANLATVAA